MKTNNGGLEQKVWALAAYKNASQVLMRATSPAELIEGVCQGIAHQTPFVLSWVGLKESNPEKTVVVAGASGVEKSYVSDIKVSWDGDAPEGKGPTGQCIRTKKTVLIADVESDPGFKPWLERAKAHHIKCSIAVPISDGGELIGALMVYASVINAFGEEEISLFESLAGEISFALNSFSRNELFAAEREKRFDLEHRLRTSLELTIAALVNTLESRDPYTAGHQNRVADISTLIAKELGWSEDRVYGLRKAALVHDIGKISVPIELLTKPTPLTPLEKSLIEQHAESGYQILKGVPFVHPVAMAVRQHHERLDGSGYPSGLKGDDIIPEARVLAIADTLEAMSTNRPYRFAPGLDVAMKVLKDEAGIRLDREMVEATESLYKKHLLQPIIEKRL